MTQSLSFAPLLPWPLVAALLALGVAAALLRLRRSVVGAALRAATALLAAAFLMGLELRETEATPLSDVAIVLTDASDSMALGERDAVAATATQRLGEAIEAEGIEVRTATLPGTSETALAAPLTAALGDVPRARLAGVFVVTDGQLTEVPEAAALGLGVPLHVLLTGDPATQRDRRVEIVSAPRYGVVGEEAEVTFRIDDGAQDAVPVALSLNGEVRAREVVVPGREVTLAVPLTAPGDTIIEVEAASVPGELTTRNNAVAIRLSAIRDRLRVLLVSGEPHAGERVWRNTLKSDPAVDLVHFTILKPMDKDARAFPSDLNLIAFPHEELFLEKLPGFDMVIFDRYTYRRVLGPYEFERIAQYVRDGGAVLIASGPEFAGPGSLADQPSLAYVLPVLPTGDAVEAPYVPTVTQAGARHPVTAGLDEASFGRWLRLMPGEATAGEVLMSGPGDRPLLVLDRVGEGRIAAFMSDHFWLWARGFDGGGPHREVLRRLVHWLMKEPSLEEEALRARAGADGTLRIERRSLAGSVAPVTVEAPDGTTTSVRLSPAGDGTFEGELRGGTEGLYRVRARSPEPGQDDLFAIASLGEEAPPETDEVVTTAARLAPLAEATGGGVLTLAAADARLPSLRRVASGRATSGPGWAGLVRREAEAVSAVRAAPLLPRWAWLALTLGAGVAAWAAEGRGGLRVRR